MHTNVMKLKSFLELHKQTLFLFVAMILFISCSYASTSGGSGSGNDAAFANGYGWLESVIHGKLGVLLAAAAFIVGLTVGISKQAPMAVVGGIIFALLIAFGVDMATGIVNSSLVMMV